jgi:hypothetical protein
MLIASAWGKNKSSGNKPRILLNPTCGQKISQISTPNPMSSVAATE